MIGCLSSGNIDMLVFALVFTFVVAVIVVLPAAIVRWLTS